MPRQAIAATLSALSLAALAMFALSAAAQSTPTASRSGPQTINPGELWPDNLGQHIQAHGGGIIEHGGFYYWFGEQRGQDVPPGQRAVSCYSSPDLVNWTFRRTVFTMTPADRPADFPGTGIVLERPKVFYNAKTKTFVMYVHLDHTGYRAAEVGVATSATVDGEYKLIKHFRPLGQESRDIGQFIDDDGTAYLIFEDRPNGWHIAKLSDDYLSIEKDVHLFPEHMEGRRPGAPRWPLLRDQPAGPREWSFRIETIKARQSTSDCRASTSSRLQIPRVGETTSPLSTASEAAHAR